MGLSSIPTRTDGSIGRTKSDVSPATDLGKQVPAAEYNRLADSVIAVSQAVGLGNGSTPGSLEEKFIDLDNILASAFRATPIAHMATFVTDGGGSFYVEGSSIHIRPGEDPDVISYASASDQGGNELQVDFGASLPVSECQVFVTPHGNSEAVSLTVKARSDSQMALKASGSLSSVERFDLMICYPAQA